MVTLAIASLLIVVMVRKLLPFVLPYGPKLDVEPSLIVTVIVRSLEGMLRNARGNPQVNLVPGKPRTRGF